MTNSGSDRERPGEFALIAQLFAPLATSAAAFGLADDAAIATPPAGCDLVVTADALVEGVHFFSDDPPEMIAKKALRVNLSDLAAKGCTPAGYLLTLSLPKRIGMRWLQSFVLGLRDDQQEFGISLLGGDTTATPGPLTIAITAFGHVPAGAMLRRAGAKAGDLVFVSGAIGDAGGGLACVKGEGRTLTLDERSFLIRRFQVPEPRTRLGPALIGLASASLDVSDGLLADLGHIAAASQARIEIHAGRLPLSKAAQRLWPDARESVVRAVGAGDDYEIAFTAPPEHHADIMQRAARAGTTVSEIGCVLSGKGIALLDSEGAEIPVKQPGYTHF
jgi:thiamine-monophosphate kinase